MIPGDFVKSYFLVRNIADAEKNVVGSARNMLNSCRSSPLERTRARALAASITLLVVLFTLAPASGTLFAAANATILVDPPSQHVPLGRPARVNLTVNSIADLYGAEVHLTFDRSKLGVPDLYTHGTPIGLGPLLTSGTYFVAVNQADNSRGFIDLALTQLNPTAPVEGSGVLASVNFATLAIGTSPVHFTSVVLATRDGLSIPVNIQDGSITVDPKVTPSPTPTACVFSPTLISPPNGAVLNDTSVLLDWIDVPCTQAYQLIVRLGSPNGKIVVQATTKVSQYQVTGLLRGSSYYWRVRACDGKTCSAWTDYWHLAIKPSEPIGWSRDDWMFDWRPDFGPVWFDDSTGSSEADSDVFQVLLDRGLDR